MDSLHLFWISFLLLTTVIYAKELNLEIAKKVSEIGNKLATEEIFYEEPKIPEADVGDDAFVKELHAVGKFLPFTQKKEVTIEPKNQHEEKIANMFAFKTQRQTSPPKLKSEQKIVSSRSSISFSDTFKQVNFSKSDFITAVTQFTDDREAVFQSIVNVWKGPIVAVVACDFKDGKPEWDPEKFLAKNNRTNIQIITHDITDLNMVKYPINYLRNLAWSAARTPFVFLLDVDFVPSKDTYNNLISDPLLLSYVQKPEEIPTEKLAYVVPAFNAIHKPLTVKNKQHLLRLRKNREAVVFGGDNHSPSNFNRWYNASKPFCTEPLIKHEYEPYLVLPWNAPRYDERFTGYSKNKKSHTLELIYTEWTFVVSPNTLVVHQPHSRSRVYQSEGKTANSVFWKQLQEELSQKYSNFKPGCSIVKDWKGLVDGNPVAYATHNRN